MDSYPVKMCRYPVSEVRPSGRFNVIEDRGELVNAFTDSNGNYLFAEAAGLATQPLIMVGTVADLVDFLIKNKNKKIQNNIEQLPEIYLCMEQYKPKERFRALFAFEDFGMAFFSQLVKYIPHAMSFNLPEFMEEAGIQEDLSNLLENIQKLKGLKESDSANSSDDKIISMKITYLPEEGAQRIAKKEISLAKLLNLLKIGGTTTGTPTCKIA